MTETTHSTDTRPGPVRVTFFNGLMLLLALAPPALVGALAFRYRIPVPVWDECKMLQPVCHVMDGHWLFSDIWEQCNEHRIVIPKLIILILARLTHWNLTWELAVNYLFGLALLALLAGEMAGALRRLGFRDAAMALPIVSILLFSCKQSENWRWGWQMCFTLATLAACASLLTLARGDLGWRRTAAAVALAVAASFSHGSALLAWPVGVAAILLRPGASRRARAGAAAAWCAAGAVTIALYRIGLQPAPGDADWTYPFLHAADAPLYFLTLLGFVMSGRPAAVLAGAALPLAGWLAWMIFKRDKEAARAVFPFAMLALYSLGLMLMVTAGRLSHGLHTARVPRYGMFAVPFWLFLIMELLVARRLAPSVNWRRACLAAALALAVLGLKSSLSNVGLYRANYVYMQPALLELDNPQDDALLARIHPDVISVRTGIPILRARKLTIYREGGD